MSEDSNKNLNSKSEQQAEVVIKIISILAISTVNIIIGMALQELLLKFIAVTVWTSIIYLFQPIAIMGYETLLIKVENKLLKQKNERNTLL